MIELVSKDIKLIRMFRHIGKLLGVDAQTINPDADYCSIITQIISQNPIVLIFDGDYLDRKSIEKIFNALRKIQPEIDILFLTSDTSVEAGRDIFVLGVRYFATKPISEFELKEVIKKHLFSQNQTSFKED